MTLPLKLIAILLILVSSNINGQVLSTDQRAFLDQYSVDLSGSELLDGFEQIKAEIADKRFVLIGEFNHGSREVFLLRNKLIAYLNDSCSFDVLLFESGIGELIDPDFNKDVLSPKQMTYGLLGGWRTKEFEQLMELIKERKLSMAGFDVQRSGSSFERTLDGVAETSNIDTILFYSLEDRFGQLKSLLSNRRVSYHDSIRLKANELIADYDQLYAALLEVEAMTSVKKFLLALKTVQNRIRFLTYMLDFKEGNDWNKRWAARDSLMAENVIWLAENIYPNQKIIVIGHNFHISKHNGKEEVMGEFLLRKYPNQMYSIGVYAKSGSYLGNYGDENKMTAAAAEQLDIKHIIEALNVEVSYLHIPKQLTIGAEWLYQKIVTNDTFVDLSNSNSVNLSKHFDGLLLLQNVSIPEK
jgi:erythromycin esterase-like protein